MAEDFAIGRALVIPQSVMNNLNKIDEKINLIASDSEKMATHFTSAMTRMDGSTGDLIKKLQTIHGLVGGIGNINIGGLNNVNNGLGKTTTEAEKVANAVTEAAIALNRFSKTWQELGGKPQVSKSFEILTNREQLNVLKEARNEADAYSRALSEANKKNIAETKAAANAIKEQSQAEKNRHEENMARLKQEASSVRINSSAYRDYVSAITMSEQTETSRLKKIERMSTVLEELKKKEGEYAGEIEVLSRKINSLTRENDRLAASRENSTKQLEKQAKLESKLRKLNYQSYVTSTEGSLRTADKANTYAQRAQAIKNLEEAIKRLRTTDANYQKDLQRLSDAHKRLSNEQKKVEANFKSIQNSQSRLMDTSGQLARQLALIFSVSQIEGYIMKMVKVRGEFELQNTALASILQNKDQADRLFAQITELAVKSPFTLKELTTYTKSLSAYSVEYEKLYDTTKMLADVSAGLGVDMQRLILAFGQVKAANFLRGTETRQFTEAGINMLGELAKYYTELEGRIVSVTEVQDRQFKRMISFQDVEQVFKRLTSAGGMFYNMQERQAETLAGMMSNLHDRIDLMLNSIGKENEGVIKGVIKILQNLIDNYQAVANTIEAIGVSFLAYKGYLLLTNKALIEFAATNGIVTSTATKQLSILQLLSVGFKKLSISIKSAGLAMKSFATSNIYILAITAIATAIYEAVHWNDEYNEKLDEINKKHSETSANLNKIASEYDNISKKAREATSAQEEFAYSDDTYKKLYSQLSKLNEELENRGYTLPIQLEFVNPENIDEAFKGGKELLDYANEFSAEFKKALASETTATEGWFGIFGDNLATDLKQLSDSYSEVGSAFKANLDIVENEVINISSKLTGVAKDYYNELREGKKEEETNTEWTLRRLEILQKINQATTYWGENRRFNSILESNEILNDLYKQRVDISNKEKEVQYELDKVLNSLIEKYGSLENLKKAVNNNPLIIKTEIDRVFEEMELGEQAKRFASFWASQRLQIPIEFTTPKELPTFYGDFRDTVKTIDTSGIFDKQLESITSLVDLEEALQKKYQEVSKQQEVLNRANTERLDLTKQIAAEQEKLLSADADEANAARLKIENLENQRSVIDKTISDAKEANSEVIKIIKSIAEAFNLSYVSQKTTTKKDTQLQRLKEQIALIKKAGEEYKKLRQYYSEEEATAKIRESFKDAFSNLSLSTQMDFDVNSVIKALEALNYKVVKGGKEAVDEVVAPLKAQQEIDVRVKGIEEIQKQIDSIFTNYEFSLELKTAGIDADAFKNMLKSVGATDEEISLAGLDVTTFEQAQKKIRDIINDLQKRGGKEQLDLAKKYQEQLTQLEVKEARKRFDELLTLREKYQSNEQKIAKEQSSIKIWEKELDDMNKKIAKKQGLENLLKSGISSPEILEATKYEISKLSSEINNEQKELLEMRIQNGNDAILKLKSEALQLTDFWKKLFGDLEDLSVNSLRRLSDTVDEVIGSSKEIKGNKGQIVGYSAEYTDKDGLKKQVTLTVEQYQRLLKQNNQVADEIQKKNPFIALFDAIIEGKKESETKLDYIVRLESILGDVSDAAFQVASDLADIFSADDEAKELISNIKGVADGAISLGTGIARIASGDVIGGAMSAISGVANIVSSINKIHDNKREQEIERQTRLVEDLERAYDKLYKTIENGLSMDAYSENANLIKNLTKQVESYKAMIAAEYDKKSTDFDRIRDWENAISDIYEQIDDLYDNLKTNLVGDFKSVSQQLGDAIAEAFANGTDAAEAWGNSVKEIVADMVKNILVQKLIEPGVQKILDQLFEDAMPKTTNAEKIKEQMNALMEQYEALGDASNFGKYVLNAHKRAEIQKQLEELKKQYEQAVAESEDEVPNITQDIVNSALGALEQLGDDVLNNPAWDMLKKLYGQEGDTMSSLQRGIEGLSETTGQALEALLSSMRFFVSDSNTVLHNIYNAIAMPTVENPFLAEMKVQSAYLSSISSLLSSVSKNVQSNGRAIKVQIV